MVKRFAAVMIIISVLFSMTVGYAAAPKKICLNGEPWTDVQIIQRNGIAMVYAMGINLNGVSFAEYHGGRTVMVYTIGKTFVYKEGMSKVYINADNEEIETAPVFEDGKLFVPVSDLMPRLGFLLDESDGITDYRYIEAIAQNIDNTEMLDGMYLSDELFINPSFESDFNMTGGWAGRLDGVLKSVDNEVYDGEKSCFVTGRTSCWSGLSQTMEGILSTYGEGKYVIQTYLKVTGSNEKMISKLVVNDTYGNNNSFIYNINTVKDEWVGGNCVVDVKWSGDVNSATFYIENLAKTGTASDTQDFYVDACSFKKLMTLDEYTAYMQNKTVELDRKTDFFDNDGDTVSVYPEESNEKLINPYKGLVYYLTDMQYSDIFSSEAASDCGIVYSRYSWARMEPEEGKYNWNYIEDNLKILEKHGLKLGIGIGYSVNYNNPTSWEQAAPQWLFDAGAQYTEEDVGNGVKLKIPVWDDPVFLEKTQNFLDSFAEHFNGNSNVAFVDLRSYGNWGEWHMSGLNQSLALEQTRDVDVYYKLIDCWKNIDIQLMMFRPKNAPLQYAIDNYGAGIRIDGTMNPTKLDNHRQMSMVDGIAPAVGEWYGQPYEYYPGGKYEKYYSYLPIFYERVIKEGKASYMALGYWDPEGFYDEFTDLCDRMVNKVGYWFKPVKMQYPKTLTSGTFKLRMKNDGVAPLFAGKNRTACAKLALADKNNNIIDTVVLGGFDPMYWKAGKYTDCETEYAFTTTTGAEKLLFGVFTSPDLENPDVKLGINADVINGYYDITNMKTTDSANIAANKLFSELEPYGEDGYGFRAPEHACDKDASTFWASLCEKGRYLEIDLGELYDVSIISFDAVKDCKTKYSIKGLYNGEWVTLSNNAGITKGANSNTFRKTKVEKIKIEIDEKNDNIFTVNNLCIR